jgi:hypothetical protein
MSVAATTTNIEGFLFCSGARSVGRPKLLLVGVARRQQEIFLPSPATPYKITKAVAKGCVH